VTLSLFTSDWTTDLDTDLTSPFSLRNALTFGGLFLVVLLVSAGAQEFAGSSGFILTSFLAGLVSSGTATTTAVTLVSTGQLTPSTAVWGVIAGTTASIIVKVFLAATIERSLIKPVLLYSLVLIGSGIGVGMITLVG
jgi:uncharacterized membrane protein (DUF4010 family)